MKIDRGDMISLKPYKCYMCEGLMGMSTDTLLFIGAAIFERSVTIKCGYCSRRTYWKPSEEVSNKNNGHTN